MTSPDTRDERTRSSTGLDAGEPGDDDAAPLRPFPIPFIWAVLGIVGAAVVIGAWVFSLQAATQPKGDGLLVPPQGLSAVVAPADGLVTQISMVEGERVLRGQQVGTLTRSSGDTVPIVSNFTGEFIGGWESVGAAVSAGNPIAQVVAETPTSSDAAEEPSGAAAVTEVTVFVPLAAAAKISPQTQGDLEIQQYPAAQFGAIPVEVVEVYRLPFAEQELDNFYGGSSGLLSTVAQGSGAVQPVLVKLRTDPGTPSGYAWTFGSGPPVELPLAAPLSVTFDVGEQRLIQAPGSTRD